MPTDTTAFGPKANILLIDDHPANLLALEAVLEDLGQNLVKAQSGQEALRLVRDHDFAVVLLDVQMPGLDGFETARQMRSQVNARLVPIIFMTAYQDDRFPVEQAYALGAVDFLTKPLVAVILRAKVMGFVDLYHKAEQIKQQADQLRRMERREFERQLAEDSNARRQAQEEARRFKFISDNSNDALFITNREAEFSYVNRRATELLGYSQDALLRMTVPDVDPPFTKERFQELFDRVQRDERVPPFETTVVRKDGSTLPFEISPTGVKFEGQPYLVASARDITVRKQDEEALRQSEEQFRTLADSIPQLAWMTRADGHILWYNRRWYDYTGTTLEQMEGWGWQSVLDPAERSRVLAHWKTTIAGGEPWEDTFPLRRYDGAMRWHLSRAIPVRNEQGQVVRWFGTNTDITDRIEMEAALKEADRRKDEFLAMLAHELRNPLAPVQNGLQILKLSDADRVVVEQIRSMMERQIGHLARIVGDLLDVSRLNRRKVQLRRERLDLVQLVRTTTEDHRPTLGGAGLTLRVEVPETPVWVMGDATRLSQVLANLLDNAGKFTDKGGSVTVHLTGDVDRQKAIFVVRDTGTGIEPTILPRLFEVFAQADQGLDRGRGGLGLGLSLIKGLVELHGGQVRAASEGPGRGAEFTVLLPAEKEPEALTEMPTAPEPTQERLRVLIIENNPDAADSLRTLLEMLGLQVAVAYSGPEGVRVAVASLPDVILCDLGLPGGLDGFGVARKLRQNPATAKARLVAISGYGRDEDRLRSQEAGFEFHLTKPVALNVLQRFLRRPNAQVPGPIAARFTRSLEGLLDN